MDIEDHRSHGAEGMIQGSADIFGTRHLDPVKPEQIREVFAGFQKYLYQEAV